MSKEKQIKQKLEELMDLFKDKKEVLDMNTSQLAICLSVIGMHYHIHDLKYISDFLQIEGNKVTKIYNEVVDEMAKNN